ncbi:MAG: tRNA lysidine(34) synthetase TilS, partial [Bacteroidia bacterium]
ARELRYNWFAELLTEHHFDYLLTAHHANDNIETFFINLLRGSGINGLKAIVPKKDKIVRPLLFATRAEIETYIAKNNILFREDSSNKEEKYLRNQLRLQVIPTFKKLNPSFEKTISNEIEILQEANLIIKKEVEKQRKKLLIKAGNLFKIDIKKLKKTTAAKLILFELISDFNFNSSQANDIYHAMEGHSGKAFTSNTHILIKDRDFLLIKKNDKKITKEFLIKKNDSEITIPIKLSISFINGNLDSIPKKDFTANKAFIDVDKISFPLTVNGWQIGDKFKPLGMTGFKKVSDFFTSQKTTHFDKQNQYIIRCKADIVWLVGQRADDRFKVTQSTKKIVVITFNAT